MPRVLAIDPPNVRRRGVCCGPTTAFLALACATSLAQAQEDAKTRSSAAPHWAFVAPRKEAAPDVGDAACTDDIDRWVLARLRREGVEPTPEADRATLLRRVSLVLTGLPPRADDVAAFATDDRPDAYERRVDELLRSDGCAEHLATGWLDLARFADTYGYQADFDCRTWPWRDWLLRALRDDVPLDALARQMIAGDLLPDATADTRLATAFFRLHRQTNEGGSIDEEWRQEYVADRVATFGTAFLGLTLGCARCHDHKSDPIPQRDFYSLGTCFSIDEAGLYPYSTGGVPQPTMRLFSTEQENERARLEAAVAAAEERLAAVVAVRTAALANAMGGEDDPRAVGSVPPADVVAPPIAQYLFDTAGDGKSAETTHADRAATLAPGVTATAGRRGGALQFDGDGIATIPGVPAFTRDDAYSLAFSLWCPDRKARAVVVHTSHYTEDADTQGYQVLIENGRLSWQIAHHWPGSAIALTTRTELPLQRWVHVVATYDGSSRAAGMAIWLDGARAEVDVVRDGLAGPATVRKLELGGRDRDRGFAGGRLDDFAVFDRGLVAAEVNALAAAVDGDDARLADAAARREVALAHTDAEIAAARTALRDARRALHAFVEAVPEIMVLAAHPSPPQRFVLRRGAYDQPDPTQPVGPGAAEAILPWPDGAPRSRLGLAQWTTARDNPLFARVAVNRLWALCFGRGLVRTADNFGHLGEPPLHRELLDALACDLADAGYHQRALLRRIVCSRTFCRSSAAGATLRERDPDNALLARGPSFRLSAEVLRDQALAASGLLAMRFGGPSVRPWQPPGLWRAAGVGWGGADYKPDQGDDAHRRSLYTFRKRTAPPPNMVLLDAPSREICTAQRAETDTPLHALVFLDDPVFVECAQALAARIAADVAEPTECAVRLFTALASRPPRPAERGAIDALCAEQRAAFADPARARTVAGIPAEAAIADDAAILRATLTLVASTLLASDAVVMLR